MANEDPTFTPALPTKPKVITLTANGVVPPVDFPVAPAHTMNLLQQAIAFVADGRPVSVDFIRELKRMVTGLRERLELTNIVVGHHYLHRFQRLCGAIEQVEAIAFNPDQLRQLDTGDMIQLLKILYSESGAVQKIIADEQQRQPPSVDLLIENTDPERVQQQIAAREKVGGTPMELRKQVRHALESRLAGLIQGPKAIGNAEQAKAPAKTVAKAAAPKIRVVASKPKPKS